MKLNRIEEVNGKNKGKNKINIRFCFKKSIIKI